MQAQLRTEHAMNASTTAAHSASSGWLTTPLTLPQVCVFVYSAAAAAAVQPVQTATYQIIVMYHVQLPGLRALFQLDIIKHGARRRRTFSKLQFITDEVGR